MIKEIDGEIMREREERRGEGVDQRMSEWQDMSTALSLTTFSLCVE